MDLGTGDEIVDLDQVAVAKLAVKREVEKRPIAKPLLTIKEKSRRPGLICVSGRSAPTVPRGHGGYIALHIKLAREKQWVADVGAGEDQLAAVHASDAMQLFRLALECGRFVACYHAVADEGHPLREIAEVVGADLQIPVRSIGSGAVKGCFGRIAEIAAADLWASSTITRQELRWEPTGASLIDDLRAMEFSNIPAPLRFPLRGDSVPRMG